MKQEENDDNDNNNVNFILYHIRFCAYIRHPKKGQEWMDE